MSGWTLESLQAYEALTRSSPINLLSGDEVRELRWGVHKLPRCMDGREYIHWRDEQILRILNTRKTP